MFNVYKLSCNETGLDYYGSTEETVEERLELHESAYKRYLEGTRKDYCSSFEIIKNNNFEIKWLEDCDDKIHMRHRENFYIDNFPCVNIHRAAVPGRTRKEYYEAHKETFLERKKEYYEANKKEIADKRKEKYTCVCGSTLRKDGKADHERTIKHKKYLENLNNDL